MNDLFSLVRYAIAPNGIFNTIQGEGHLIGLPMNFVRLAGCSIGCNECDTNYRVDRRLEVQEIAKEYDLLPKTEWSWVTGGEPFDYDLWQLLEMLRLRGRVAVATSGMRANRFPIGLIDFLSVSPHRKPDDLVIRMGSQVNLVPGLNELKLEDWEGFDFSGFKYKYVTPLSSRYRIGECEAWVKSHQGWRMGVQAHVGWGMP